jgi:hypothetical protein
MGSIRPSYCSSTRELTIPSTSRDCFQDDGDDYEAFIAFISVFISADWTIIQLANLRYIVLKSMGMNYESLASLLCSNAGTLETAVLNNVELFDEAWSRVFDSLSAPKFALMCQLRMSDCSYQSEDLSDEIRSRDTRSWVKLQIAIEERLEGHDETESHNWQSFASPYEAGHLRE